MFLKFGNPPETEKQVRVKCEFYPARIRGDQLLKVIQMIFISPLISPEFDSKALRHFIHVGSQK